jgi:hypothetical protein
VCNALKVLPLARTPKREMGKLERRKERDKPVVCVCVCVSGVSMPHFFFIFIFKQCVCVETVCLIWPTVKCGTPFQAKPTD